MLCVDVIGDKIDSTESGEEIHVARQGADRGPLWLLLLVVSTVRVLQPATD